MLFLKQNLHKEEAENQVEVCGGRGIVIVRAAMKRLAVSE